MSRKGSHRLWNQRTLQINLADMAVQPCSLPFCKMGIETSFEDLFYYNSSLCISNQRSAPVLKLEVTLWATSPLGIYPIDTFTQVTKTHENFQYFWPPFTATFLFTYPWVHMLGSHRTAMLHPQHSCYIIFNSKNHETIVSAH
jgi:hypothetical protein